MIPKGLWILHPWQYPAPEWMRPWAIQSDLEVNSALSRWLVQVTLQGPIPPGLFCDSKNKNTPTSDTNPHSLEKPKQVWMLIEQKIIFLEHFQTDTRNHGGTLQWKSLPLQIICSIEVNITLGKYVSVEVTPYFVLQPDVLSCALTFFWANKN